MDTRDYVSTLYAQKDHMVYKDDNGAPKLIKSAITNIEAHQLAALLNQETHSDKYKCCPMTRWLAAIKASDEAFKNALAGK